MYMNKTLSFLALMLITACCQAQTSVTIVDCPEREQTNANYTNFREPLQQAPLLKLPVGKVQPKGWLRKYLELQRDGLNGQLGTVSAWLDKNNNQWLSNQGDHGWEEVPYWLRGYSSLAFILDDAAMKSEVDTWINAVLNNQASFEGLLNGNYKRAIELEKRAIKICNADENLQLAANLHMNLGYLYQADGQFEPAKSSMEKAMQIIAELNEPSHDVVIMSRNYARLLAETGEARRAVTALQKCAELIKSVSSEQSSDYADVVFDIAAIHLQLGDVQDANSQFSRAFKVYRKVLLDDDIREKAALAVKYFERAGISKLPDYLSLE